ncbi:T9SS type A sorting domain-containing protein [Formosa maritima]|uniref:T9SS type A sorting domain-containing protein n=1 Tax=Formosa maritima TaxID=2592046 RepID=A0A5D0GDC3_9FLAO|nr:T9SS type A sorting domain-containing protein [Formosa maritima]TYA56720.1 T9SS type A sorting domain-containing protein [Formosa maritima]
MRKITFLLMMLLSITAFSQVEIVENFDSGSQYQLPNGWTESALYAFTASSEFACGNTGLSTTAVIAGTGTSTLTTPNYTAVTNATDLSISFSINVFEQDSQFPPRTYSPPASNWGSLVVEYTTDGGTTWTNAVTIDDSNFTYVGTTTCMTVPTVNAGALVAGSDFQARFVATSVNVNGFALMVKVDNISITQVATTVPNCDLVLLNPTDGSSTADTNVELTWQPATGIPTGYKVSVGTTSGGTDIVNEDTTTGTTYSLNGLGLLYETEYFVNIVPYNSYGDAMGCIEKSFTTRVEPIEGAACSRPHVVSSFPYLVAGGNTANYENNVNTGSCGANNTSYITSNDVFYEITPAADMSINIDLVNINNNNVGMHLMKGCPTDTDKECIGFDGEWNTSAGLGIYDAVLYAGNTYFLVLSAGGTSTTYTYDLIITQNSCINPTFTLTNVPDCGTGMFSIDVDVTSLGSATTLTLTDGTSSTAINALGLVNIGPYQSGETITVSITNDQDNSCSYTESIYFYCPPSNDECANAISLSVNTDDTCTLVTSATNAGATESMSDPASCNGNTNDVWFSFVADGSSMILEYLNVTEAIGTGGIFQSTELYEGSCGTLTSLACFTGQYAELVNLTDGNTYYLRNKTNITGEYAQNFDVCLKTPPAAPSNDECSNATILTLSTDDQCDNQATGTTLGATPSAENTCNTPTNQYKDVWYIFTPTEMAYYSFSVTTSAPASPSFSIYSGTCGALTAVSSYCSTGVQTHQLNSGESYYVMVRSNSTSPGFEFNLCVWQLPPAVSNDECSNPTILLESIDSNGNNAISGTLDNSYPSSESCSSNNRTIWYSFTPTYTGLYNFNLTQTTGYPSFTVYNTDDCLLTSGNYVSGFYCYNSGLKTAEVVAGTTYLIAIHGSRTQASAFDLMVYPDPSLSIESTIFETFKYYPNPVVNTLTVEAKNTISKVSVYNIVGQQVLMVNPNSIKSTIDMDGLKDGVYFVTVTIDGAQKTIKVVKR